MYIHLYYCYIRVYYCILVLFQCISKSINFIIEYISDYNPLGGGGSYSNYRPDRRGGASGGGWG